MFGVSLKFAVSSSMFIKNVGACLLHSSSITKTRMLMEEEENDNRERV
jgi:hypothetical protein